ncbi:Fc receptor-like protein 5 isoform X2 [Pimephales promelas]|uniref:Fc receptor-like protein 5 isoform X2 n=1 Tax=Pimephales promelas TaxID=90988 RepID=UPI0019555F61|nr:Fc receptor-like protein 5 isoform X2 [Pimephales promelas]
MELSQLPLVLLLICKLNSGQTEDFPKPTLTVEPQSLVFTGDRVTLRCSLDQTLGGWEFFWSKDSNTESTDAANKVIDRVQISDGGQYRCRARRDGRYTDYSEPVTVTIHEIPKSRVTIKPDQHVFRGETVTLRCDIDAVGVSSWKYNWYKEGSSIDSSKLQKHTIDFVTESDAGKYSCNGWETDGSGISQLSDEVTLTVSDKARAVLSVSPQTWLTEGDPVTLNCEVNGSSTGWTFSWFTVTPSSDRIVHYDPLSDSRRGAGGKYTVSSVAVNHTGVYVCKAERGKPVYIIQSSTQPLWVTGVSPPVSLIISPSRTQHFTSDSLSLSCEDQSNSDGWTVTRYTKSWWLEDCSLSGWGSQTGSTCTIRSTRTSDTAVYWCQSKSGEKYHPVNITVHSGVILESPVHPVTEGDNLTLRCLYNHTSPSILRSDFYKDESLVQSQTIEMIIPTVSKSHEGFYYCKHPRGESLKSWISVRVLISIIHSGHTEDFPKPTLTVEPQSSVFTGDRVTLTCSLDQTLGGWEFLWSKDSNAETTDAANKVIDPVQISDGGQYRCRARREGRYTDYSEPVTVTIHERPKPRVTIKPDQHVFRGETVTLRCDIDAEGVSSWMYNWFKEGSSIDSSKLQEHTISYVSESDAGKYSCNGWETEGSGISQLSDEVTLTVSVPRTVLSVSPQTWLTEGDPVTLNCEVNGSSTGWTFSWFTENLLSSRNVYYEPLSDSRRGAGGKYTISSVALNHTGVYMCRAERGKPVYTTWPSNRQPLWVTGVSPPVSLIISPSRTQHFTFDSLSLSCEDQSNSDGWTVGRYTESLGLEDCSLLLWGSQTGSTCTISSTSTSYTGVYWCQSKSGEKYHPVNITVHSGVILESPVHPVTEGDNLTLRCLYNHTSPPILRSDFYKDESLVQSQTIEMIIPTVSKSHEGFYYCKHPRGESLKSWISVRVLISIIHSGHTEDFPKPTLTVETQSSVITGDRVTLRCSLDQTLGGWEFLWSKDSNAETTDAANKVIDPVQISDGGQYRCRARRGGRYTDYSEPVTVTIYERPKPRVTIKPDQHVFSEETVTLRCDIDTKAVSSWMYYWYKEGSSIDSSKLQEHTISYVSESDAGKYSCYGWETDGSGISRLSDEVTLTVSDEAQAVLSVSPQTWLTEGDPVTLNCEVNGSSTGWTFSWFTASDMSVRDDQLSDSRRGAGGKYTVSSVTVNHTGVYVCEAERGKPAYKTYISNRQPLWVTGVSPPVSLIISPSRTQHFTSDSLSLSCEDQSNSDGWTVTRFSDNWWPADCSSFPWGSQTGSTCTISSTSTSDTAVYWCQSKSGEKYHPVNITVHSGVILESPVHPVTEGDNLTLRCLYNHTSPSILRSDFYKDESLVQNQTIEMIIPTVSKSHEGFYYCKHPRGESLKSWISVRASGSDSPTPVIIGVIAGLTVAVLIIVFLVLLWCCRNKGVRSESRSTVSQQQNISQTSEQNQSEAGHNTLSDDVSGPTEITYAEVELKSTKKQEKENKGNNSESGDIYSQLKL